MSSLTSGAALTPSDTELLWIETEVLSTLDARRRVVGEDGVAIGATGTGHILMFGAETADDVVHQIELAVAARPAGPDPSVEPPAVAECRAILAAHTAKAVAVSAGPSYVIPVGTVFASGARIVRSDTGDPAWLGDRNPGSWEPHEWIELLDGAYGPWAMAVVDDAVASVCHTPRKLTDRGAECGIWTHPAHRRRGHAAAAVAAWAEMLAPTGRHLFYSTSAENLSSQAVAARLGLRSVGWFWKVTAREDLGKE